MIRTSKVEAEKGQKHEFHTGCQTPSYLQTHRLCDMSSSFKLLNLVLRTNLHFMLSILAQCRTIKGARAAAEVLAERSRKSS